MMQCLFTTIEKPSPLEIVQIPPLEIVQTSPLEIVQKVMNSFSHYN